MPFDPLTGRWTPSMAGWGPAEDIGASVGGLGVEDYWARRTMQQDWARMEAELPADPRWRQGLATVGPRLQARYMLAEPYMPGEADAGTSFAQYLSDIGGNQSYQARDIAALRARAGMAAEMATMPMSGLEEHLANPAFSPEDRATRRAYWGGTFGPSAEDSYGNQMAVAQMLARQRPGGGVYRGRLGEAMGRALSGMAASRMARGAPTSSFLDWYLKGTERDVAVPTAGSLPGQAGYGPYGGAIYQGQ